MRLLVLGLLVMALPQARPAELASLVPELMRESAELADVPFAEVIHAATGHRVLPLQVTNPADARILTQLSRALDVVMAKLNSPDSPAHARRRINEVSTLFESAIQAELNAIEGFICEFAPTANGQKQRSGYPDLRLTDKASGRTLYLDPKLHEHGNRDSSLRTFYYEPKRDTNKILTNAHHLVVGFEHTGKEDGRWNFAGWELIDLSSFRVRLKAEFQASNRELYRPEAIVLRSSTPPKAKP